MTLVRRPGAFILAGILVPLAALAHRSATGGEKEGVEGAVLAVNAEMTKAAEAGDADRLFSYVLDNDKGSIIQDGLFMATRQEARDRVENNLGGVSKIRYSWKRQYVTVLSPEVALLTAEGESTVTTTAGATVSRPFAQTVVFVSRAGGWKVIHAHQSSSR